MADSFAGYALVKMDGIPDPWSKQFQDISRIGVEGNADREFPKKGTPFTLQIYTDFATPQAAFAFVQTLKNLEGTVVSLVRAGRTLTGVKVLNAKEIPGALIVDSLAVGGPNGGACYDGFEVTCKKVTSSTWS